MKRKLETGSVSARAGVHTELPEQRAQMWSSGLASALDALDCRQTALGSFAGQPLKWHSRRAGSLVSDLNGIEHTVEVIADSLYEAVARGLAAMRAADWTGNIGHGHTTITVVVKQPEVEHKVRMRDFEA